MAVAPAGEATRRRVPQVTRFSWLWLLRYMVRSRGILIQLLVVALFLQLLGLAMPISLQLLVDRVIPLHLSGIVAIMGFSILALMLCHLAASYLRTTLHIYLRARLDSEMMLGFVGHLLRLPYGFYQERTIGDLALRLQGNARLRETLVDHSVGLLLDGSLVVVYLLFLLLHDPLFCTIVLAIGLLQVTLLLSTTKPLHHLLEQDLAAGAAAHSYLVEALTGIGTLKASGAEERIFNRWSDLYRTELRLTLQRYRLTAMVEATLKGLHSLAPLVLLWVGALRVLDGTMTLGSMLALNVLATAFLGPLLSLAATGQHWQLVRAYLARVTDVLAREPEQLTQEGSLAPTLRGHIELRDVSFAYSPEAQPTLSDLSLTIEPGQKVALVGRTGAGKTTLALLILGLQRPNAGTILYDGVPLEQLDTRALRAQIGVVLQDCFLFAGTVRQNIAFNQPDLPLERLREAACRAAIHDEIMRMPDGYETHLAEGGKGLSGGQRQRLAIARAVAHRPPILVLDEATSHLDVLTERRVDEQVGDGSCTRIVIAHRLSTIRNADVILVLDGGRIAERGTHDELLARGGEYAELVRTQLE